MNIHQLQEKFNESINWNAASYLFYKGTSTVLTFALFKKLTTQDFSIWATTNSIIFILLLWIDFGFRKSVPRFCPEFSTSKNNHKQFILYIIIFQSIALLSALPLLIMMLQKIVVLDSLLLRYATILFFLEGITALLRLVYHAHFWNKHINMRATAFLALEMIANIFLIILFSDNSQQLLMGLFITKICAALCTNVACLLDLPKLHTNIGQQVEHAPAPWRSFIKHSGIMWLNNNLKSLSERNFIIPLLTYTVGPAQANFFKIANEAALFFHRIIIKTIGSTDTALLSHAEVSTEGKIALPIAFKNLTTKVAGLCIPVIGFLIIFFVCGFQLLHDTCVLQTFFIITLGYLLETLMSPYERLLEVKSNYLMLAMAYAPYAIVVMALLYTQSLTFIGLLTFVLIIQGVRLVSSLLMMRFAQRTYDLVFPLKDVILLLVRWLLVFASFFLLLFLFLLLLGELSLSMFRQVVEYFFVC